MAVQNLDNQIWKPRISISTKLMLYIILAFLTLHNLGVFDVLIRWVCSFLPARRYASAGLCDKNVSVCQSVCLSVCHAPVLCQNEES